MGAAGGLYQRSIGWRVKIIKDLCADGHPQVSVQDAIRAVAPAFIFRHRHRSILNNIRVLPDGQREWQGHRFHSVENGLSSDASLLEELYIFREYEAPGFGIRPGDIVVDCGANIGLYALYALQEKHAGYVLAIEPEERNLAALQRNLAPWTEAGRAAIVEGVVWDRRDTLDLRVHPGHLGHSLVLDAEERPVSQTTQAYTIDELVEEHGIASVDFIKVDVEGAEPQALRGASGAIIRHKPRMVVCTYHCQGDFKAVQDAVLNLRPDYRWQIRYWDYNMRWGWTPRALLLE
jgi:FkbM family methyltransferase